MDAFSDSRVLEANLGLFDTLQGWRELFYDLLNLIRI
jgi:hypothetical protein